MLPDDFLKSLVYGVYILEFAQSILIIEAAFPVFVMGFEDVQFEVFDKVGWDG